MYLEDWQMWCLFIFSTYPIVNGIFKKIESYFSRKERECDEAISELEKLDKYFRNN
tara:strand:- start:675 stop:842 length:168 start_codon:yes stop_codon:yes gene_type:complete